MAGGIECSKPLARLVGAVDGTGCRRIRGGRPGGVVHGADAERRCGVGAALVGGCVRRGDPSRSLPASQLVAGGLTLARGQAIAEQAELNSWLEFAPSQIPVSRWSLGVGLSRDTIGSNSGIENAGKLGGGGDPGARTHESSRNSTHLPNPPPTRTSGRSCSPAPSISRRRASSVCARRRRSVSLSSSPPPWAAAARAWNAFVTPPTP